MTASSTSAIALNNRLGTPMAPPHSGHALDAFRPGHIRKRGSAWCPYSTCMTTVSLGWVRRYSATSPMVRSNNSLE